MVKQTLFEQSDILNVPVEGFYFDTEKSSFPIKPHFHYYMEIILMLRGTATMHSNKESVTLKEGEIVVFHPNAVHSIYSADGEPLYYGVLKLDINRMNLASSYSPKLRSIYKAIEQSNMPITLPAEFSTGIGAEDIFADIIRELNGRKYNYDMVVLAKLYILLTEILRYYQSIGFNIDSNAYANDTRYDVFCITDYIDSNLCNGIKVNDIAAQCGMSYSYFAKKFQSVYHKSCKEYIEELRIYKAEELLTFTDFDLNYIAEECGFSDCSHLINNFKKYKNVTPKQFRKARENQA